MPVPWILGGINMVSTNMKEVDIQCTNARNISAISLNLRLMKPYEQLEMLIDEINISNQWNNGSGATIRTCPGVRCVQSISSTLQESGPQTFIHTVDG